MAAAAPEVAQPYSVDVADDFAWVEKSLRKWAVEGPPGNQRSSAAALADKLSGAMSSIEAFASEHGGLQKEKAEHDDKLAELEKYVSSLKACIDELKSEKATLESDIKKQSAEEIASLQKELRGEKDSLQALKTLLLEQESMWQEDSAAAERVALLQAETNELRAKLEVSCAEVAKLRQREATLSAQAASALAPVSVMCRMRPLESYVAEDDDVLPRSALQVDGGEITVQGAGGAGGSRKFLVDRVLEGGQQSQEDVYSSVAPWIENVMGGGSACIMAYGATGSGKTYTVLGSNGRPGIAHYALKRLIDGRSGGEIKLTMVEVYCDQIRDLLVQTGPLESSNGPPTLQCSRRDARGRVVLDCAEAVVSDFSKAEEILRLGFRNRTADATLCNDQSSRSHVVLTVEAVGQASGHATSSGKLVLIDLAGSENIQKSGADEGGKLLAEAKAINRSLSALADVVQAVAKRQQFVPYRNSRLTVLLEETLSSAKICLLVHVSPLTGNVCNTGHTLQFAERIRAIDFGAQQLRKDQEERLVAAQRRNAQENRQLQGQLDEHKKELTLLQQREQDGKQQISRLTEQLREKQRDLTREQELRSKIEASSRELKKNTTHASGASEPSATFQRPRSPLLRQQGQPPPTSQARRVGVPSTLRRHPETIADEGIACVRIESSTATRQVLGDLTNCESRTNPDGKLKGMREAATPHPKVSDAVGLNNGGPIVPSNLPEAGAARKVATITQEKLSDAIGFATPTKRYGDIATECGEGQTIEMKAALPAWPALSPASRLKVCEDRSASLPPTPTSNVVHVKPALRKVPTNFTERSNLQRSLSCPVLGRKEDTKIKFAEQLQEASSPPKWYMDWLANDESGLSGRRERKVQPVKLRELSPRRVHEPREVIQPREVKEAKADHARWR